MRPLRALGDLLDALVEGQIGGPAGYSAAVTAALAAALVARTARSAAGWPDSPGMVAQAETLRVRLLSLAERDRQAHEHASALLARVSVPEEPDTRPGERDRELAAALHRAASVPLEIAEASANVCAIAAESAGHGPAPARTDGQAAADLALGATIAAARLVLVNLAVPEAHPLAQRARTAIEAATAAQLAAEQSG